jgi:malate synthase
MEDAATAEIFRSQLWQWRTVGMRLDDGRVLDETLYRTIRDQEVARLGAGAGHIVDAARLLDDLVLASDFPEFLTLDAYRRLQ